MKNLLLFSMCLALSASNVYGQEKTIKNQGNEMTPEEIQLSLEKTKKVSKLPISPEGSRSAGDDCANPIILSIPQVLPYSNSNSTCGRGNTYQLPSSGCMSYYTSGEDIIYRLDPTSNTMVNFTLDPQGTTYTGIGIFLGCPNTGTCLVADYGFASNPKVIPQILLIQGNQYYVIIDTWASPNCIPSFEFDISLYQPETCEYRIDLYDSYGDGWNGGLLNVFVGNSTIPVLSNITLNIGSGPASFYFTVPNGEMITTTFTAGGYPNEPYYYIYEITGPYVWYSPPASSGPPDILSGQLFANCQYIPPQPPDVNLGPDVFACVGEIVTLDAGNHPGATYLWSPGNETTQTIQVSTDGLYAVTVTGAYGSGVDQVMVTFYTSSAGSCEYRIDLYDSFGDGWNGGYLDVLIGSNPFTTILDNITLASGYGPASFYFTVPNGEMITTTFIAGGWPLEPFYYIYDNSGSQVWYSPTAISGPPDILPNQLYVECPCGPPVLDLDLGPDQFLCDGETVVLDAGNPGATYQWSTGETTQTITVSASGNYYVIASNPGGSDYDDIVVTFYPLPIANAGSDVLIYIGYPPLSAQLSASGGVSYQWSPATGLNDPNISNPIASPASTTIYTVTVTDANGCTDTDEVTVEVCDIRCNKKNFVMVTNAGGISKCVNVNAVPGILNSGGSLGPCQTKIAYAPGMDKNGPSEVFSVSVYPNPFENICNIEITMDQASQVTVRIIDLLGRVVGKVYEGQLSQGIHNFTWSSNMESNGGSVYYLQVITDIDLRTIKMLMD